MMSLLWIIPLIVFAAACIASLVVVIRKIPQLTVVDASTAVGAREHKVKESIIMQRFDRLGTQKLSKVASAATATVRGASNIGRRAVQRLYALEQYYQKLKKIPGASVVDPDAVKKLLAEAEAFTKEGEYIQGEKRYIEVIGHNPKLVDAYEGLGNLYLKAKQLGQARETFVFALRLSPDDASIHMSLADVDVLEDHLEDALKHLRTCVTKRPNNPKYLDAYIETALSAKSVEDAGKGITSLKAANPENQKIEEFERRLAEITPSPPLTPSQEA